MYQNSEIGADIKIGDVGQPNILVSFFHFQSTHGASNTAQDHYDILRPLQVPRWSIQGTVYILGLKDLSPSLDLVHLIPSWVVWSGQKLSEL